MKQGRDALRWNQRLPKAKLRQLYLTEARGIYDEDLIDDVGMYLYMRCRDILTVKMAKVDGLVRCPVCDDAGKDTFIRRCGDIQERITCPVCGWEIIWQEYIRAVKGKQLNAGGAVGAFKEFIRRFETAKSPKDKMLAIDRLIHAFHYSARERPDQPTRPAGVNLISGNLKSVIEFLDTLSAGGFCTPEMADTKDQWKKNLRAFETIDWENIVDDRRKKRELHHDNE